MTSPLRETSETIGPKGPPGAPPAGVRRCDVLVMGGGPAGSTAAILLARRGYDVVLLEKSHHPRFHIGESLLPANLPLLERLGVASEVRAIGMEKWGAEFTSPSDGRHQIFEFSGAWDSSLALAYQVRRSEFDEILIRRAGQAGAHVIEGCRAREVVFTNEGGAGRGARVEATGDAGTGLSFEARYLIDATGRDTLLGQKLGAKRRSESLTTQPRRRLLLTRRLGKFFKILHRALLFLFFGGLVPAALCSASASAGWSPGSPASLVDADALAPVLLCIFASYLL